MKQIIPDGHSRAVSILKGRSISMHRAEHLGQLYLNDLMSY